MGKGALKVLGLALLAAGVAFAACSGEEGNGNGGGGTSTGTGGTTTTSTGTGATTTTTTTGSGGAEPIVCGEPHTNIEGECDLINQDCPPGEWCDVAGSDGNATAICKPHFGGLKAAGDDCDGHAECGVGMLCLDGNCSPVCCPDSDVPCEGGTCDMHLSYGGGQFTMHCSYNVACTLFAQDCPDGEHCHISNPQAGLSVCDEPSPDLAPEGDPCEYRNDCGDSQHCNKNPPDEDLDAGILGRCRYYCMLSDWQNQQPGTGGCEANQNCVNLGLAAFPDLGLCIPE